MRDIEADPMNFYPIAELARETYAQFIIELLAHDINTTIIDPSKNSPEDTNGADRYYELLGMPNSVRFTAGRCSTKEEELELSDENEVTVIEYDTESRQILRTLICEKAVLHIEGDKLTPTLTMDISNARKDGSDDIKMRDIIHGLIPPQIMDNFSHKVKTESGSLKVELLTFDLLELSGLQPSDSLKELESELSKEIRRALVQIIAEIHTRLVFGIGCIPMILIGIGLGIIKKGGHLLTAFGASCIPAAVLIVCMMSGKNLIKSQGLGSVTGIALMWAGLVFLILLVIAIYHRLLKN